MKFKVTQPFIAFGITAEVGDVVDLTEGQANALREIALVAPYEVKIMPPVENKAAKKSSQSVPPARVSRQKTARKSEKKQTKS